MPAVLQQKTRLRLPQTGSRPDAALPNLARAGLVLAGPARFGPVRLVWRGLLLSWNQNYFDQLARHSLWAVPHLHSAQQPAKGGALALCWLVLCCQMPRRARQNRHRLHHWRRAVLWLHLWGAAALAAHWRRACPRCLPCDLPSWGQRAARPAPVAVQPLGPQPVRRQPACRHFDRQGRGWLVPRAAVAAAGQG